MMDTIGRARMIGAVVLLLVFGAGVAVGHYVIPRRVPEGIVVSVKASNRIPRELEALALSDSQRARITRILGQGTSRVGQVLEQMMVPMNAVIEDTDREVRTVLTAAQNRRLDELRRDRPLRRMRQKRVLDSAR
jgi:hypothetical protein